MGVKVHSIKYNFIMNIILTASNFLFPLITFPYVTRILQADNYGKVSFVSAVASYFMMLASLGVPTYGIRECAKVRDDNKKLSNLVQELLIINMVVTLLTLILYGFCVFTIARFREEKILFIIYGVGIALNYVGINWLYQGLEKYDYITIRSIAVKVVSIVLMFILVHTSEDYIWYACVMVFSMVGANIFNIMKASKIVDLKIDRKNYRYDFRRHMKPIIVMFAQSLAISIYTNLDSVMLGIMKTNTDVGLYNAAIKFKGLLVSIVAALGNVALPRMSYFAKKDMHEKFYELMKQALNFSIMVSIPICVYFICMSKEILMVFAGLEYVGAVVAMKYTICAVFPNGMTGILGTQVLTSVGKEKNVLISVVGGALADFVLNIFLIPEYSYNGAAFATMVAEYMVFICQLWFARKYILAIRKDVHLLKYLVSAIVAFVPCFVIIRCCFWSGWILLTISLTMYCFSYFLCLLVVKEPQVFAIKDKLLAKIKH